MTDRTKARIIVTDTPRGRALLKLFEGIFDDPEVCFVERIQTDGERVIVSPKTPSRDQ